MIAVRFSAIKTHFSSYRKAVIHCFFHFLFSELMITMFANFSFQPD